MRCVSLILLFVFVLVAPARAQQPLEAKPLPGTAPISASTDVPNELALELELHQTRVALTQARADLAQSSAERIALEARLAGLQLSADQVALEKKAIAAMGGNPSCDTWDWKTSRVITGCQADKKDK